MAQIILSEAANNANSLYGEIQGPLKAFLESRDSAWEKDAQTIMTKIFKETTSRHASENYGGMSGVDAFAPVGENGDYPVGGAQELPVKTIRNQTWKGSFAISEEMMEDKLDSILVGKPTAFMDDYHRKKTEFFFGLLGAAMQNVDALKIGKFAFDVKTADGARLFSQTHKMVVKGKNQCNAFSDTFSADALSKVSTAHQNLCDDDGNILSLNPDTIIIPNFEDLKKEVFGVIGAHNDPATAAGNKYNYLFGNWTVYVCPWLNKYCGDSRPWILMDSGYNKAYDCAINQNRSELRVTSTIADNDANVWKGRARFAGGFVDFRAFVAGGLSFGASA